jgi:flavin-binding protein dodecin
MTQSARVRRCGGGKLARQSIGAMGWAIGSRRTAADGWRIIIRPAAVSAAAHREGIMAVATVTKITAGSPTSFDQAVKEGIARASKTLRGITGLHVIDQKASVAGGKISEYRVTMEITFVLED